MSAIVLPDSSGLAQGITSFGSALGQALGKRNLDINEKKEKQRQGSILQETIGSLPEGASPLQVTKALTEAVNKGVPPEMAQQYGTLYATLQKAQPTMPPGPEQIETMSSLFQKFGMPQEVASRNAELWANLTVGGQTEMAKLLVDQIARNQFQPPEQQIDFSATEQVTGPQNLSAAPMQKGRQALDEVTEEFTFPKVNIFEDRTPKERAQLKSQLLKENNVELKDVNVKARKIDEEIMRYEQLEQLNESKKLPEGLQRLNIDWAKGDIRIPFLANPETQLFVKTINDFTVAAKDTFGARVTNFELGAFMKRLPTLANSEEGRRMIIEQMKAMKELDKLYYTSIQDVYNKYGIQKIDRSNAEKIAKDMRKDKEEELKKRFKDSVKSQESFEMREKAPEGHISVQKPDGSKGYLPIDQIDIATKKGWKIL